MRSMPPTVGWPPFPMGYISAPVLYEVYPEAWQTANLGLLPTTAQELLDACIAFSQREGSALGRLALFSHQF